MPSGAANERVVALGPLRHACHGCGTCCTGCRVTLHPHERAAVTGYAAELGIDDPFEGELLRHVGGACVFLTDERRCAIHARWGLEAKPSVCRIFPRLALRDAGGLRVGIDPGCSSTWRTYADGPEADLDVVVPRHESIDPALAETERHLIAMCRAPGMTLAKYVGVVSGQPGHAPKLPPGFVKRVLGPMKALDFLLTHEAAGPLLRADIDKAATFIRNVDAEHPPRLELTREVSALTLEVLQRTLFLRIGDAQLPPMGKVVLMLAGAIACAYVYRDPERFGRGLAAWSRLSRLPGFWAPFIPDAAAARFILTGAR